jgi:hypothetical protein
VAVVVTHGAKSENAARGRNLTAAGNAPILKPATSWLIDI